MAHQRILADVMGTSGEWADFARNAVSHPAGIDEQVEIQGTELALRVEDGELKITDLEGAVAWTEELVEDIVTNLGTEDDNLSDADRLIETLTGEDFLEASARLYSYRTGQIALGQIPSKLTNAMDFAWEWKLLANEIIDDGRDLEEEAERQGKTLTEKLIAGEVSIADLRRGISWVNALDKEVVETIDSPIEELGHQDRLEATARRLAHSSGKAALHEVRSESNLRQMRLMRHQVNSGMPGMGSPEKHDHLIDQQ
ncbi:MAG TPA: hypothetical protein VJC09_00305 [Candidatus Saccharimonadales bacterium]|nr:hypothetical protein [Candidatus Saccharimonadales bacterium]